jgi:hypothetical protein
VGSPTSRREPVYDIATPHRGGVTAAARRAFDVARLAEPQLGVVSRDQLRQVGILPNDIRNNVVAGRWQVLSRRAIALFTGPLTSDRLLWFAVLDGGPDCVLAGLSCLHQHGLTGFPVERLQTAVPVGGRPARSHLVVRRVSRRLCSDARHPVRLPPMMRIAVALLDALENTVLPRRGCALLAAVVQQRLLRAGDVRPLLVGEPTLRHRHAYLAVAGDIEGGAHSLTEIDFRRLARPAGLAPPQGQAVRLDGAGRRRYLDVDFGGFAVEVDGAVHLKPLSWWDDTWRLNEILIGGKPTLRFPSVGIYLDRTRVVDQLGRAAARWPVR